MKILVEGKAHKANAWTSVCPFCESKLRILDGDPMSFKRWRGTEGVEYDFHYICPVCREQVEQHTYHNHASDTIEVEEVTLNREDREEMESWKYFDRSELSNDDITFIQAW